MSPVCPVTTMSASIRRTSQVPHRNSYDDVALIEPLTSPIRRYPRPAIPVGVIAIRCQRFRGHIIMRFPKSLRLLCGGAIIAILGGTAFLTRDRWMTMFASSKPESHAADAAPPVEEPKVLKLSEQARKNLGLVAKPARTQTYWRNIQVPGEIDDRPGQSDRGVTSPTVGVVSEVHAFPRDTVRPGDRLFTLRLIQRVFAKHTEGVV